MAGPDFGRVRTVFLDRDGTINVKAAPGSYITSASELRLLPGAAKAIAALNTAGLRTIIVTNQRWLSSPLADANRYTAVHERLTELLAQEGAWVDAAYHCPHAEDACSCRKPAPGMLLYASREHEFELSESVMIGDSDTDVMAGRLAGAATILLGPENGLRAAADALAGDLASAVQLVLDTRPRLVSGQTIRCRARQQTERERQVILEVSAG